MTANRIVSLGAMVKQCAALVGTGDLNAWEADFMRSIIERTNNGDNTTTLSPARVECLEAIYRKNFA